MIKKDDDIIVIKKRDLVKDFKKVLERLEDERKKLMMQDFAESFGIKIK